MLFIFVID